MNSNHSRIQAIETFFLQVYELVGFMQVTPINLHEIEPKLRRRIHNPTFVYAPKKKEIEICLGILSTMVLGDSPFEKLLEKTRVELISKCSMMLALGTPQFTKWSIRVYGKPSNDLVKKAKIIVGQPHEKTPLESISYKDAHKKLSLFFQNMHFPKWTIVKKNIAASALVATLDRQLILKKKARFSKKFVERLCIHEIGTHAARFENGMLHDHILFASGTAGYLKTEEGLAAYNEELTGCLSQSVLRTYAGRVLAIDYAMKHSFVDTYQYLCTYFSKRQALTLTIRAKRGLQDTTMPGACTKDILYLEGYLAVKKFAETNDIRKLYVGKIGIDDLQSITEMHLKQPKYLPEHLQKK